MGTRPQQAAWITSFIRRKGMQLRFAWPDSLCDRGKAFTYWAAPEPISPEMLQGMGSAVEGIFNADDSDGICFMVDGLCPVFETMEITYLNAVYKIVRVAKKTKFGVLIRQQCISLRDRELEIPNYAQP